MSKTTRVRPVKKSLVQAAAMLTTLSGLTATQAMQFDTGNPDLSFRWDNTIRLNAGWRVQERDQAIANNPAADEGDYRFDKGDMISKRADLLTEAELVWKKKFGARVSAAGWYDDAYSDHRVRGNPAYAALGTSYFNAEYSSYTKRYFHQGGEVLDAFAFSNFDVGSVPVSVKAGRFSTFWGQALFYQGGIASGQQPIDGIKSTSSPGTEVRETFLPLAQVSVQAQLLPTVAVGAQYYADWKPTRGAEGGTYFGGTDFALQGPDRTGLPAPNATRAPYLGPERKRGNFGLFAKFMPEALSGQSFGIYYREFDAKVPWFFSGPVAGQYRAVYSRSNKILGLSYDGSFGPFNVGGELGFHKDAGLQSRALQFASEGAVGDTWHALVNASMILPSNPISTTGTFAFEVTYDRLDKVTRNAGLYNGCTGTSTWRNGCATKEAWGVGISLTPQWPQAAAGLDLSMPMRLTGGLSGNSAGFLGVNENAWAYSVGLEGLFRNAHRLTLLYAGSHAKMLTAVAPGLGEIATGGNGPWQLNDRGRITLTYKYDF